MIARPPTKHPQPINQLNIFQQERNPRREPLPNHFQWFLTGKAQTHKLGPGTAINAQALAWQVSQLMIAPKAPHLSAMTLTLGVNNTSKALTVTAQEPQYHTCYIICCVVCYTDQTPHLTLRARCMQQLQAVERRPRARRAGSCCRCRPGNCLAGTAARSQAHRRSREGTLRTLNSSTSSSSISTLVRVALQRAARPTTVAGRAHCAH
jgi:hypothetical protein